jgi:response regulator RpfG family c-di-GMP phosphodiesterase
MPTRLCCFSLSPPCFFFSKLNLFLRQRSIILPPRCTIIGLTGTSSKENDAKWLEAGMSDILLKPITRKLLLDKVELWMQNKTTAKKTQQRLLRDKATDKQLQSSNDSSAAYSSKVEVMKFKAVVFGNVVFGVCTRKNGLLPQ